MSASTDLTQRSSIAVAQRDVFAPEQVTLIKSQVMPPNATMGELAIFLETCVRHDLDPFIKEVWAIRMTNSGPVQTVVAKDGLLKIANRCTGKGWANQPGEFLGVKSGAIHEHDHYDLERDFREDGTERVRVIHKPRNAEGKAVFGGRDMSGRGALVGSWAVARRRGHDDVFFECSRAEYDKGKNAWSTHPHAMMVKVAESVVLRKAFPIAGVVGEGELDAGERPTLSAAPSEGSSEIVWPENEELSTALQQAFRALGYKRAKVRALVSACETEEDFSALLDKLNTEADQGEEVDAEPVAQ